MNISEWLKKAVFSIVGTKQLGENPGAPKFALMSNPQAIRQSSLDEYDAWFSGQSSELLNIYSEKSWIGWNIAPIYFRNKQNYFWAKSSTEADIKRSHSGFPRDFINAMADKIGSPKITAQKENWELLKPILIKNEFTKLLIKQIVPWTLVEGDVVLKPVYSKIASPIPTIQVYKSRDVEPIMDGRDLLGVVFKEYYKDEKGEEFVLCEVREAHWSEEDNNYVSTISYHLFKKSGKFDHAGEEVPLTTLEKTKGLKDIKMVGLAKPFCTLVCFYPDADNPGRGISAYSNKLDIFDSIDEAYSVMQHCVQKSEPIEYINPESCEKDKEGRPIKPSVYNRQFVMLGNGILSADGDGSGKAVICDQPNLDIAQYLSTIDTLKTEAISQFMSPASMGIGLSGKDNADSQREKEKQTISSRNYIIDALVPCIKEILTYCIMLEKAAGNYGEMGVFDPNSINVDFADFASPTFETRAKTLTPMLAQGAITPTSFVDELWRDGLSDERKREEIDFITAYIMSKSPEQRKQSEDFGATNLSHNGVDTLDGKKQKAQAFGTESENRSYEKRGIEPPNYQNAKRK